MINRVSNIQTRKNKPNFGHGIEIYRHGSDFKSDVMPKSLELNHYKTLLKKVLDGDYSFVQLRPKRSGSLGQEAVFRSKDGDYLIKGKSTAFPDGYIEIKKTEDAEECFHFRQAKHEGEKHSTADSKYTELADAISKLIPQNN